MIKNLINKTLAIFCAIVPRVRQFDLEPLNGYNNIGYIIGN